MPFLWKKMKNTKISQLVSDHLVVETGFPTSLVDLFFKNRERLNKKPKSSKMKKKKKDDFDNKSFQGTWTTNPTPSTTPPISRTPSLLSLASTQNVSSSLPAFDNDVVDEEMNEKPNVKGVIGAILRMFFVVVLALGANKFVVGLTMSAFALFLLEFVLKHSYRLLKIQRILQVFGFRDKNLDDDDDKSCVTGIKDQLEEASSEFNDHVHTRAISEFQPIFVERIQVVRKEIGESSCYDRREFRFEREICKPRRSHIERSISDTELFLSSQEKKMDHGCDIADSKKCDSKRARMKSKMKHLVPRRLRSSKKEKRGLEGETSKMVVVLQEPDDNEQQGNARNLKRDSKLSTLLSREYEESDRIDEILRSSDLVNEENSDEIIIIKKDQENIRNGSSGYLILCVIVLTGLFGGRIIAFMLMALWFLMLKSGERLRRLRMCPGNKLLREKVTTYGWHSTRVFADL